MLIGNPPATFIIQAEGASMQHAPIQDGDYLIVDRSVEFQDGDIILAEIESQITVKTFRRTARRTWLQPENPAYPDIELSVEQEAKCWGVVTGSFRQYKRGRRYVH